MFEDALAEYCGAPYAVTVNSCTNALFLSLLLRREQLPDTVDEVSLPKRTYVGVAHAALNAGFEVAWSDEMWWREYEIKPVSVWDSAKALCKDMYHQGSLQCVSFHIAKKLPLGHGGVILCSTGDEASWLKRARFDGRTSGETGENATKITRPGHHMHMTPDEAARGLWLLANLEAPLNASADHYPDISELL